MPFSPLEAVIPFMRYGCGAEAAEAMEKKKSRTQKFEGSKRRRCRLKKETKKRKKRITASVSGEKKSLCRHVPLPLLRRKIPDFGRHRCCFCTLSVPHVWNHSLRPSNFLCSRFLSSRCHFRTAAVPQTWIRS